MQTVLAGLKVLDFGRYLAGPYCAALLGDLGADVVRVDRVGGSEDRYVMPVTASREGSLFLQVNRNKRSITLDPLAPGGGAVLRRLVAASDVVVANMPEQSLRQLGLDYASLRAIRDDVILTTATAFDNGGPSSHRLGFDGIGQAVSGAVYLSGLPDQPVKAGVPYVDYATGLSCALGTVAAILARVHSGQGQHVQGSLLATALNITNAMVIEQAETRRDRVATLNRSQIAGPSDIFRTSDGWIIVQVIGQGMFRRWTRMVGAEDLLADPRYADDTGRGENGADLSRRMSAWCAERSTAAALDALNDASIPAGPVLSPQQVLDDAHIRQTGLLCPLGYPGLTAPAPVARAPFQLSETPTAVRRRPPTLGEHTDAVLAELGFADHQVRQLRRDKAI